MTTADLSVFRELPTSTSPSSPPLRRSYSRTFATMAENGTMELPGWRVRGQISQQSTDGQQATLEGVISRTGR